MVNTLGSPRPHPEHRRDTMNVRPYRHWVFALALGLFAGGIAATVASGVPTFLALSYVVIAVATWAYGWKAGGAVMLVVHGAGGPVLRAAIGPGALANFHILAILVPVLVTDLLLILALAALRRSELAQAAADAALRQKNVELEAALAEVKELRGILPMCAWCKSIRDVDGLWDRLEEYLAKHSNATLTHGICPACLAKQIDKIGTKPQPPGRGGPVKTSTKS
jgi:hypothetical protein